MAETLQEQLIRHEGLRLKPYRCPTGKLTIGVGRNLEDRGITESEARVLLNNDIMHVWTQARHEFAWFEFLDVNRQNVVLNMIFNMGLEGFKGFKRMIAALKVRNYELAAMEMLDSKWAREDVAESRSCELARIMDEGQ